MIPIGHFLALAAVLFAIGVIGVVVRRSAIIVLMSIEIMLNAANLTLIAFSRMRHDPRGQTLAFLVVAVAAAEAAVGLAIIVSIFRSHKTVDVDAAKLLHD